MTYLIRVQLHLHWTYRPFFNVKGWHAGLSYSASVSMRCTNSPAEEMTSPLLVSSGTWRYPGGGGEGEALAGSKNRSKIWFLRDIKQGNHSHRSARCWAGGSSARWGRSGTPRRSPPPRTAAWPARGRGFGTGNFHSTSGWTLQGGILVQQRVTSDTAARVCVCQTHRCYRCGASPWWRCPPARRRSPLAPEGQRWSFVCPCWVWVTAELKWPFCIGGNKKTQICALLTKQTFSLQIVHLEWSQLRSVLSSHAGTEHTCTRDTGVLRWSSLVS